MVTFGTLQWGAGDLGSSGAGVGLSYTAPRKTLRITGAPPTQYSVDYELESLLNDPDPRVRRAAIDGLIDYRYWFGMGKNPIKTEQFTPGMLQAVRRILSDQEESWWLVDGALMLLRQAPAEAIVECLPLIKPWVDHDDWWLREDAFIALSGLQKDPEEYRKVLPIMLDILKNEYHTMPRDRMRNHFKAMLRQHGPETDIGRTIIVGVKEAVQESEIKEGLQAREGAWNVLNAAKLCLERDPSTALAVGEMIRQRMDSFDTGSLITLVGTPNSNEATPTTGFYPALESLEGEQREMLESLLYEVYRELVENYVWWKDRPAYRPFALSPEKTALLKKGTNVLAAYGNMEYHKHTKEATGQMDLYIEGLRLDEILD